MKRFASQSLLADGGVFLCLFVIATLNFRYGILAVPKQDHLSYMAERFLAGTDSAWFWHSVSYTRTRFLSPGDTFLFRPFLMIVLALEDIFFRDRLVLIGLLGFLMQAFAGFALYKLLGRTAGMRLAFLFAVLYVVQFAGMEMVLWRHITPYAMSLACVAMGLRALETAGQENDFRRVPGAAAWILAASFFHEAVLGACCFTLLILAVSRRFKFGRQEKILLAGLGAPVILSLACNVTDYWLHGQTLFAWTGVWDQARSWPDAVFAGAYLAGGAALAFVMPMAVWLVAPQGLADNFSWSMQTTPKPLLAGGGVLLAALLAYVFCKAWRAWRAGEGLSRQAVPLYFGLLFVFLVLGLSVGRAAVRGTGYVAHQAPYYFSMTSFLLCVLCAEAAGGPGRLRAPGKGRLFQVLLGTALVALIILNSALVQGALKPVGERDQRFYDLFKKVKQDISQEKSVRLAVVAPGGGEEMDVTLLYLLMGGKVCLDKTRRPVYLLGGSGGRVALAAARPWAGRRLTEGDFDNASGAMAVRQGEFCAAPKAKRPGPVFMLTKEPMDVCDFKFVSEGFSKKGLVLDYVDNNNFFILSVNGPYVTGVRMVNGRPQGPSPCAVLPEDPEPCGLEVRRVGDVMYFFVGDCLVFHIRSGPTKNGRIGFVVSPESGSHARIYDASVSGPCGVRKMEEVFERESFLRQ